MNYADKSHKVAFNKDPIHPLLTRGWKEMHDLFGFERNQEVVLFYFGNDLFGIYHTKKLETPEQIPTYHSRALSVGHTMHFYLQLNSLSVVSSHLRIHMEFEDYVRACSFRSLIISSDNGSQKRFEVFYIDEPVMKTAIGIEWKEFCTENGFKDRDILCFKFEIVNPKKVNVFKVRM